jgi:hypothetical protein
MVEFCDSENINCLIGNFKKNFIIMRKLVLILFCALAFSAESKTQPSGSSPDGWKTHSEASNYSRTPTYKETISFSQRLDASSDRIVFKYFGKSSEGRGLPVLIAASEGEFTPRLAKTSGKPVILIQAAIHAGESDGKDAGLALLRDIAITKERKSLIDDAILLFVPIYNVDGHELFSKYNRINQNGPVEMGFRANSANQNLNRDYLKADTPETRAWLDLWNKWDPDFFIDCHVTDGADFQYNITYEFAHHAEIDGILSQWMKKHFEERVVASVEKEGNLLSRYIQMADRYAPEKGIFSFIATPRFATGYTPLRNRIGLLIEAHSVKPYVSRVKGTYAVLRYMIEEISSNKQSLFDANRKADESLLNTANTEAVVLMQRIGNKSRPYNFKGFESQNAGESVFGGNHQTYTKTPKTTVVPQYDEANAVVKVRPPDYYIIPPQWHEVIARLGAHGVKYTRTKSPRTMKVESYRFEEPKWASASFEGRLTLKAKAIRYETIRTYPANSVVVPYRQKAGRVALHFLEPGSPDSAFYWGFFNAIFEQKEYSEAYVMEKIAREMLKKNELLRKEYEEKLKDPAFAKSKRQRQRFFYERSPYYDSRIGVYPVGRVLKTHETLK